MNPSSTLDTLVTLDESSEINQPVPGLLMVFSNGKAVAEPIPLPGPWLEIGRGNVSGVAIDDPRMSRQHALVRRNGEEWDVQDRGSRNGSWLDGEAFEGRKSVPRSAVLRCGSSVFLFFEDLKPFIPLSIVTTPERIMGPGLRKTREIIARAAKLGNTLHVTGESGTGKELAARDFHAAGPNPKGPFVAVNCSAIPGGLAERLLFGAVKGAFSGAHADVTGYLQSADGGTIFLDEIGDLDLSVQPKLLRALETGEVLPLGASRPIQTQLRLVSATHKSLRALVAENKFREDLFFRLARPEVSLPPLRARREEIPQLIALSLQNVAPNLELGASFVEECLLRPWPGNVRELFVEVRQSALHADVAGAKSLERAHLQEDAARGFEAPVAPEPREDRAPMPEARAIEEALAKTGGKVASAARLLGIHRNRLRRYLEKG